MRQRISISESEWQVMKVLWGEAPRTLPEILDSLRDTGWSKTTIQTYLARLVKKGGADHRAPGEGLSLLPRGRAGRVPARREPQLPAARVRRLPVQDGPGFVQSGDLTKEELDALRGHPRGEGGARCRSSETSLTRCCSRRSWAERSRRRRSRAAGRFGLRCPLWAAAAAALLFCVPVLSPDVRLFSPEEQIWLAWYCAASRVWACGAAALLLGQGIRALLASRALRRRPACRDARLRAVFARCAAAAGLRRAPDLRSGAGEAAACVAGALRPVVLVNEAALAALAEEEVEAVLLHELTHIRRRHLLLERAADLACALCWFQPLAWLARRELALQCEIDCDRHALAASGLSRQAYAGAILRLLERSAVRPRRLSRGMGALSFSQTRRRLGPILAAPRRRRERWTAAALVLLLLLTFIGSARLSRSTSIPTPPMPPARSAPPATFLPDKTTNVIIRRTVCKPQTSRSCT